LKRTLAERDAALERGIKAAYHAYRLAALLREAIGDGAHDSCPICTDATECRGVQALREWEEGAR